ncbi:2-oxo acid dehydrogenase subunit E2 [Nonomuraea lactucae]|uniref:2-oxo acid dehydrogenase subunit E2 n=1 Tax=Nonomuraea lactucae TaxID=2249762 RepID=UPI001F0573FE|nr:2-oxo acid dehydrogenase subunit E2 [Nonomuraea lactucae]
MAELRVPKLNNNDTEYLVIEWLAADGAQVEPDDPVVVVETSKAAEELPASAQGTLRHALTPGAWCRPDDLIATITPTAPETFGTPAAGPDTGTVTPSSFSATATSGGTGEPSGLPTSRDGDVRFGAAVSRDGDVRFGAAVSRDGAVSGATALSGGEVASGAAASPGEGVPAEATALEIRDATSGDAASEDRDATSGSAAAPGAARRDTTPPHTAPSGAAPPPRTSLQGGALQGGALQGTAPQDGASQGGVLQGTASQGTASQAHAPQGTASQHSALQARAPQGATDRDVAHPVPTARDAALHTHARQSTGTHTPDPLVADPLVTVPAQALIDELRISPEQVRGLGVRVVRRADVERLAQDARRYDLPRGQRAVARAVELSHETVPAAYVVVRMDLGPALERARAATKEVRRPVGLAEVFVQAVAGLHERFPLFFATLHGTHATLASAPNIGVTLDVGEGLYVPVIHDAARRTTKEIATTLMKHRLAATSGDFKEADLGGANFVVTLHTEGGVVLAIPFVFPGTVCALAVTAPHDDGSRADIGLAYDHRLINGRDAALFMAALKTAVEGADLTGSG